MVSTSQSDMCVLWYIYADQKSQDATRAEHGRSMDYLP